MISELPDEILLCIFTYTKPIEFDVISSICINWKKILTNYNICYGCRIIKSSKSKYVRKCNKCSIVTCKKCICNCKKNSHHIVDIKNMVINYRDKNNKKWCGIICGCVPIIEDNGFYMHDIYYNTYKKFKKSCKKTIEELYGYTIEMKNDDECFKNDMKRMLGDEFDNSELDYYIRTYTKKCIGVINKNTKITDIYDLVRDVKNMRYSSKYENIDGIEIKIYHKLENIYINLWWKKY